MDELAVAFDKTPEKSKKRDAELPPVQPMSPHHEGPVGDELKRISREIAEIAVRNLNYNAVNDSFEWTGWRRLPAIVSTSTISAIEQRLNVRAWLIADRWAFQIPQEVKAMEAAGSLLTKLAEQEWLETEQGVDPKTGVVPDSRDRGLLNAPDVLRPETVTAVLKEPLRVQQIADRWASGSPKKVKQFEANGTLLQKLRAQAQLENEVISKARVGGAMSDVPDSEILALAEIPPLP